MKLIEFVQRLGGGERMWKSGPDSGLEGARELMCGKRLDVVRDTVGEFGIDAGGVWGAGV